MKTILAVLAAAALLLPLPAWAVGIHYGIEDIANWVEQPDEFCVVNLSGTTDTYIQARAGLDCSGDTLNIAAFHIINDATSSGPFSLHFWGITANADSTNAFPLYPGDSISLPLRLWKIRVDYTLPATGRAIIYSTPRF
jgi:hypothetical protein